MARKRRKPCPAGIEDRCPIPRYRCREVGVPGEHCFELFAEFEALVFPVASGDEAEDGLLPEIARPERGDDRPPRNPSHAEIAAFVRAQIRAAGQDDEGGDS